MKRRTVIAMGICGIGIGGVLTGIPRESSANVPYSVSISNTDSVRGNSPLDLSFEITDDTISEDSPAWVDVSVTNTADQTVEYTTGTPKPFGVLLANGKTLWTEKYREDPGTNTKGKTVVGGTDGGPSVVLQPDEKKSERYELRSSPGEYTIREVGHPLRIDGEVYKPTLHITADSGGRSRQVTATARS
jgi:hypothetical protein